MTTPAQKAGLKVGDKIIVIEPNDTFIKGDVLELIRDDTTSAPFFKREFDGLNSYYWLNRKYKRQEKHMNTKKQEALDQIAALQKFVEELDTTPEETPVRVYIKKDATATKDYTYKKSMAGNVFDMYDSNYTEDVYTIWQDDEHSDYWMFNKSDCVIVEGKV